jgi:glutathione S-transferase
MAAMPVPKLKLIYLDHHYWRAECSRLALHIGDVPFEDARLGYDDMYASGALTFGTFPALVVEGKGVLNQTQAIARYVGSVTGLYPADPFLAAKCDEAVDALTDVSELITATMKERDPKRKIAWRQHLISAEGRMTMLLRGLEAQQAHVAGPFVAGADLSVADLAVWRAVGWLSSGVIDGIPKTFIKEMFPGVWAVHAAVDAMPEVAAWKRKNPHHYKK